MLRKGAIALISVVAVAGCGSHTAFKPNAKDKQYAAYGEKVVANCVEKSHHLKQIEQCILPAKHKAQFEKCAASAVIKYKGITSSERNNLYSALGVCVERYR